MIKKIFFVVLALFLISSVFSAKDYEAFIEIDYNFDDDEKITCIFKTDSLEEEYTFTDTSSYDRNNDFDEYASFECDRVVEEITLLIEDREGNEIFDDIFRNTDFVEYTIEEYEYFFEIDHNFNSNQIITCDLDLDDKDTIELEFEESGGDDKTQEGVFLESFSLRCSDNLDEIHLIIDDSNNFNAIDSIFENQDDIEYDIDDPRQIYEMVIEIEHEFEDDVEIECDYVYDSDFERSFLFDENDFRRIYLEDNLNFGRDVEFSCDEVFDQITYLVYNRGFDDDLIFQKTVTNVDGFSFLASELDEDNLDNEIPIENDTKSQDNDDDVDNSIKDENITDQTPDFNDVFDNTSSDVGSSSGENNNMSNNMSSEMNNESEHTNTDDKMEDSNGIPTDVIIVFSIMLVLFFSVLIGIILLKK